MDLLPQMKSGNKSKRKRSADSLKIVYISSPMKVKTSASRFRTLVQELTGRDSDISRFMDTNAREAENFEILPENYRVSNSRNNNNHEHHLSSFPSFTVEDPQRDSPTSSDSLLEQPPSFSDLIMNEQYYQYQELLKSDLLCDSSQLDVLGSYDAL